MSCWLNKTPKMAVLLKIWMLPVAGPHLHHLPPCLPASHRPQDTNGCQFFITAAKCDFLDGKHVVFGRVLGDGLLVLRKIENVACGPNNKPRLSCLIAECGEM